MPLTFKSRIAWQYVLVTAALVALAYATVLAVVHKRVYADLDRELRLQAARHQRELLVAGDTIRFAHKGEWEELEHQQVDVAPVFVQLSGLRGQLMDRSPNLKADELLFHFAQGRPLFDAALRGRPIRQLQEPIVRNGRRVGYLLIALPTESARHVLDSLTAVLLVSYPMVLLALYLLARVLAGRSIAPIAQITATTNRITRHHLSERVPLPARPDELYTLGAAINGLLDRLEQAVEREKQFTADASHELRTPLAVLKGTLEVLLRKPRTAAEYSHSIGLAISEIDRMANLADQLLQLARFDGLTQPVQPRPVPLLSALHDVLYRLRQPLQAKRMRVDVHDGDDPTVQSDPYLLDLILDNLLSNAVKYSPEGSTISLRVGYEGQRLRLRVADQGIGIRPEELERIFAPLYRSDALEHREIGGTGLGLSIVAKACQRLGIELSVQSEVGKGTEFRLLFP